MQLMRAGRRRDSAVLLRGLLRRVLRDSSDDERWRRRRLAAMVARTAVGGLSEGGADLVWFLEATSKGRRSKGAGAGRHTAGCHGAGCGGGGPDGGRRRDGLGAEPAGRQAGAYRSRGGALEPATAPGRPPPAAGLRHSRSAGGRRQRNDGTAGR